MIRPTNNDFMNSLGNPFENPSSTEQVKDLRADSSLQVPVENKETSESSSRIHFFRYLDPLVNLLLKLGRPLWTLSVKVLEVSNQVLQNIQTLFLRSITDPIFDPETPTFEEVIKHFNQHATNLEKQLKDVNELGFRDSHLIFSDLKNLKQLHFDITETVDQLNIFAHTTKKVSSLPISQLVDDLSLRYQALNQKLEDYLNFVASPILAKFQAAINVFVNGKVNLPKDIQNELNQGYKTLEVLLKTHLDPISLYSIEHQINQIGKLLFVGEELTLIPESSPLLPLKLGNNTDNRCYLDSLLQFLLCDPDVCHQLKQPFVPKPEYTSAQIESLRQIQQEIIKFIDWRDNRLHELRKPQTHLEYTLYLCRDKSLDGPSLERLRSIIFNSGLVADLRKEDIYRQQDAPVVLEVIAHVFLQDFLYQERNETIAFPGMVFPGPKTEMSVLQLPFADNVSRIENMLKSAFNKHKEIAERSFDPNSERKFVTDETLATTIPADAVPVKVTEYQQEIKLFNLPSVIFVQMKRFGQEIRESNGQKQYIQKKIRNQLVFPRSYQKNARNADGDKVKDGIINLFEFIGDPKPTTNNILYYEIISYIVHQGESLNSGHYISYMKIADKYYCADDLSYDYFREITKEEFLYPTQKGTMPDQNGRMPLEDVYLIMLKKVTDSKLIEQGVKDIEEGKRLRRESLSKNSETKSLPPDPINGIVTSS